MPIKREIARAYRYFDDLPDGVVSMGRAGSYKYIDIDDIVWQAMTMAKELKQGGFSDPVPVYGADQAAPNTLMQQMVGANGLTAEARYVGGSGAAGGVRGRVGARTLRRAEHWGGHK